jgi:hypothetical protein
VTGKFWPFIYETEPIPAPGGSGFGSESEEQTHSSAPPQVVSARAFDEWCPRHALSMEDLMYSTQLMADPLTSASSSSSSSPSSSASWNAAIGGADFGLPSDYPSLGSVMNSLDTLEQQIKAPDPRPASASDDSQDWSQTEDDQTQLLGFKLAPSVHRLNFHPRNKPKPKATPPPPPAPVHSSPPPPPTPAPVRRTRATRNALQPSPAPDSASAPTTTAASTSASASPAATHAIAQSLRRARRSATPH